MESRFLASSPSGQGCCGTLSPLSGAGVQVGQKDSSPLPGAGIGVVNKAEIDSFLELLCFFYDPTDVGNLISPGPFSAHWEGESGVFSTFCQLVYWYFAVFPGRSSNGLNLRREFLLGFPNQGFS